VGKIKRRKPAIVDDFRFAKAQTGKPIKMAVPGPMTVIDSTLDEAYHDEGAMAMDVAAALNEDCAISKQRAATPYRSTSPP
jgi:5-methyltetrahydropteroyltriglutamate--homocysteine methyltransferase